MQGINAPSTQGINAPSTDASRTFGRYRARRGVSGDGGLAGSRLPANEVNRVDFSTPNMGRSALDNMLADAASTRSICDPCSWGGHLQCTGKHCDCCGDYVRTGSVQ